MLGKSYRTGTADKSTGHCQHFSFPSVSLMSSELTGSSPEFVLKNFRNYKTNPNPALKQEILMMSIFTAGDSKSFKKYSTSTLFHLYTGVFNQCHFGYSEEGE